MIYLLAFTIPLLVSFAATPVAKKLAVKLNIIDSPGKNRWNERARIPSSGGLAIFTGFMITSVILVPIQKETLIIFLGAIGVFILGLIDDKLKMTPLAKGIIQFGISLAVTLLGLQLKILPAVAAIPLTILWIVMIINAFNLIDNMDGLSPGVATIAAAVFFLFAQSNGQTTVAVLSLAMAGACLGFLKYNFNPATIFMGDCGSYFIGYILSIIAILGFWQETSFSLPTFITPVLVLLYAIFDLIFVAFLRMKGAGYPWIGGKDHTSHRLVMLGLTEKKAILILYLIGMLGSASAFLAHRSSFGLNIFIIAVVFIMMISFGWVLTAKSRIHFTQKRSRP